MGKIRDIKIFKVNDCDWVAAETLEEAIQCAIDTCGYDREEACDESVAGELSYNDMINHKYIDEDVPGDNETFQDVLSRMIRGGEKFPQFFASSEY